MPNSWFRFKQFIIHHDRCAMKVGTDGVLLGAWANHPNPKRILDIGAGTGLISLMAAQRFPQAQITGIEIDPEAAAQATENVSESVFAERVSIEHGSLQEFEFSDKFDLIISNPPFFKVTSRSESENRNLARQLDALEPDDIFAFAKDHLVESGKLCLIFPTEPALESIAEAQGLRLTERVSVKGNAGAEVKRYLYSFSFHPLPIQESTLVIEESRAVYTPDFKALVNDFYLNL